MMTDRRPLRVRLLFSVVLLSAMVLGCARRGAYLELTSHKDPYSPETYRVELSECAYQVGPGGDYHIVGRARHVPEDGSDSTITQLLHVHMFWKPLPGKTFDHPSSADATIRYAIVTEQGATIYSGTGFVYPEKRRTSDDLLVTIEGARLRLQSQAGNPPELLGAAELAGKLVAQNNPGLAVDLRRQLDLHGGTAEGR